MQIRRKRFFSGRWTVPHEQDCVGIVLYSVLKSVRWGLSDESALDQPLIMGSCFGANHYSSWLVYLHISCGFTEAEMIMMYLWQWNNCWKCSGTAVKHMLNNHYLVYFINQKLLQYFDRSFELCWNTSSFSIFIFGIKFTPPPTCWCQPHCETQYCQYIIRLCTF